MLFSSKKEERWFFCQCHMTKQLHNGWKFVWQMENWKKKLHNGWRLWNKGCKNGWKTKEKLLKWTFIAKRVAHNGWKTTQWL